MERARSDGRGSDPDVAVVRELRWRAVQNFIEARELLVRASEYLAGVLALGALIFLIDVFELTETNLDLLNLPTLIAFLLGVRPFISRLRHYLECRDTLTQADSLCRAIVVETSL